ncbi:hypothetical protein HO133_005234 [Letharia lupina]|uniref:L-ornithine N(5)-monooxygenase n=1 Tax=Letharia lupina TaxID=560253 RepID=A0A8H6F984_9LECA|nr:uncharacterized protein HO133_005234 [Letharia lupina]KAF6219408.1 hypothetical protein HO133_005234 [Letharia lupina]
MAFGDSIRVENGYQKNAFTHYPVLIIGAGESGLAMGCRLKEKFGFDQFRIFDRQSGIGDVTELRYVDREEEWEVTLSYLAPGTGDLSEAQRREMIAKLGMKSVYLKQEKVRAKIVVSCVGILVEPNAWPTSIPGRETFRGEIFHSARWRDDTDFREKDVVVVGSGCSAAQIVPSLFEEPFNVRSITQIMRTAPWVMPRLTEPFGKANYARYAPMVFRYFPFLGYLIRVSLYLLVEVIWLTVFQQKNAKWRAQIEASTLERMYSIIPKKFHTTMKPNHSYGCKRRVFDSAWLNSMSKPNFDLTNRPLKSVEPNGVVLGTNSGDPNKPAEDARVNADIIVLANGFEALRWFHPLSVYGRSGRSMHDVWDERGGPQAYMGTAMDGFPNFFIATGPNSANGHASLILESENITEYILRIVEPVLKGNALYVEPKKDAEIKWTADIQRELKKTVFPGCTSWYQDERGWNSTMYPYVPMLMFWSCYWFDE